MDRIMLENGVTTTKTKNNECTTILRLLPTDITGLFITTYGSVTSQKAMSLQLLQKISGKSMFADNER